MTTEQEQNQKVGETINDLAGIAIERTRAATLELMDNDLLEKFIKLTTRKIIHSMTGLKCDGIPPSFHVLTPMPANEEYQLPPGVSSYEKNAYEIASQLNVRCVEPECVEEISTPEKRDEFLFEVGHEVAEHYNFPLAIFMVGQAMFGKKLPTASFEGVELKPALTVHGLTIDGRVFSSVSKFVQAPGGESKSGILFDEPSYFFSHQKPDQDENIPQIPMNVALDSFFYEYFCGVSHWYAHPKAVTVLQTLLDASIEVRANAPH